MNITRWMMSLSLALGLCVSTAVAQDASQVQLRQPGSVQQVAYDYGDYYGDYYAEENPAEPRVDAAEVISGRARQRSPGRGFEGVRHRLASLPYSHRREAAIAEGVRGPEPRKVRRRGRPEPGL